ncbi:hypothetical protein [Heyndrickxia coagulans]|uniref:hypothetical protein n=1 Tax=Heyndrickxia coagulans TaxID=1398 RepID=UPI0018A768F4|nr:hypothetical protein [Heyndrickxia coagulans]MBF8418933.1 hypothetical protein [Heyndrickxia coagulans]
MNWEKKAVIACKKRGLYVLGFEAGYVFVKDNDGEIFPINEYTVADWSKNCDIKRTERANFLFHQ